MFSLIIKLCFIFLYFIIFSRYHLGDYGGEILNEVKVNRSEKELYATPATLHNGNHHKVQECKTKVNNSLERIMGGNINYIMWW